jgi:hypothetical protein
MHNLLLGCRTHHQILLVYQVSTTAKPDPPSIPRFPTQNHALLLKLHNIGRTQHRHWLSRFEIRWKGRQPNAIARLKLSFQSGFP